MANLESIMARNVNIGQRASETSTRVEAMPKELKQTKTDEKQLN